MNLATKHRRRGFILQEVIVGLIIFGIAMIPLLRALWMIPRLTSTLNQQSRRESWRSAADHALAYGVSPGETDFMSVVADPVDARRLAGAVRRTRLTPRMGASQIVILSQMFEVAAESRSIAAGVEIGASAVPVPPRADPLPPLPAIRLGVPILNPSNGSLMRAGDMEDTGVPDAPFQATIRASAPSAAYLVQLRQSAPRVQTARSVGTAILRIDAADLARSVRGQTWTEYAGEPATDTPVVLSDGQTRWLVHEGPQVRAYEPSEIVDYVFGIDIGSPVYRIVGIDHGSGEAVSVDMAAAHAIESGAETAIILFPENVRRWFGREWPAIRPSFTWSFGSFPGDSSLGNTISIYQPPVRTRWNAEQTLSATPSTGLEGLRAITSTWTLRRLATSLEPPERVPSFYDAATDAAGMIDFVAPMSPSLSARVGRPRVNGVESVTETLSVPVVP
jgi:hypothetical protein